MYWHFLVWSISHPLKWSRRGLYDIHCSQPLGGIQDTLASLYGGKHAFHLCISDHFIAAGTHSLVQNLFTDKTCLHGTVVEWSAVASQQRSFWVQTEFGSPVCLHALPMSAWTPASSHRRPVQAELSLLPTVSWDWLQLPLKDKQIPLKLLKCFVDWTTSPTPPSA